MPHAEDVAAIERLKYRYLRCLDSKRWEEFAQCMTPDVRADYGGLAFADRDTLLGYLRENLGEVLGEGITTVHHVHHPEIDVDGDTARGRWHLHDRVLVPDADFVLEGGAFYEDVYVRGERGWLIATTGYQRTYELTWAISDLPKARLRTGPGGPSSEGASEVPVRCGGDR